MLFRRLTSLKVACKRSRSFLSVIKIIRRAIATRALIAIFNVVPNQGLYCWLYRLTSSISEPRSGFESSPFNFPTFFPISYLVSFRYFIFFLFDFFCLSAQVYYFLILKFIPVNFPLFSISFLWFYFCLFSIYVNSFSPLDFPFPNHKLHITFKFLFLPMSRTSFYPNYCAIMKKKYQTKKNTFWLWRI